MTTPSAAPTRLSLREWLKTITFYEIAVGMKATLMHLLNYKPITLQYPHEKRTLP
ncbi:MAG: NADH-quinone oxidoreductase subunit NuoI, partial [Nitrospira sp.]|nr:NADH-quinone oxidoreductase subunit NuoI [Nitrospira sp.]